jgi:hypothetical protein
MKSNPPLVKPISGFPGYLAASDGCIRGPRRELKPFPNGHMGYLKVNLHVGTKMYLRPVHNLVCETFHGPRPGPHTKWHAAHRDGDVLNNSASNLRWATAKENVADTVRHGRKPQGEQCSWAKLTRAAVKAIRKSSKTKRELACLYGVAPSTIQAVRTGPNWRNV